MYNSACSAKRADETPCGITYTTHTSKKHDTPLHSLGIRYHKREFAPHRKSPLFPSRYLELSPAMMSRAVVGTKPFVSLAPLDPPTKRTGEQKIGSAGSGWTHSHTRYPEYAPDF